MGNLGYTWLTPAHSGEASPETLLDKIDKKIAAELFQQKNITILFINALHTDLMHTLINMMWISDLFPRAVSIL